jgi:hypothetical protein
MSNRLNIDDYASSAGQDALLELLYDLALDPASEYEEKLFYVLTAKGGALLSSPEVNSVGGPAALFAGARGLPILCRAISEGRHHMPRRVSLEALWEIANGKTPSILYRKYLRAAEPVDLNVSLAAKRALIDLMIDAQSDLDLLALFLQYASEDASFSGPGGQADFAKLFLETTAASTIRLTGSLLDQFAELIDRELPEAEYQDFLTANPVLLDPLAAEIVPLAPLGLEFKTDFIVRRHDGRYLVVEIEKPQDPLLTKSRNLSHQFTHALGQVLDFQDWVQHHVAYAQSHFPGINNPAGLLIMGRRSSLTSADKRKVAAWERNSSGVRLATYDDLLSEARQLLVSIRTPT